MLSLFCSVAVTSMCGCYGFGAEKKPEIINLQCHVVQKSRKFISLSSHVSLSPNLSPTLWGWQKIQPLPPILEEINCEYSLEALILKLQYFGHLMRRGDSLEKTLILDSLKEDKGMTENEMVGWHH